jgi:drug/metabolite transporter (DMT)-like permease
MCLSLSEHWTIYHTLGGVTILVGIILAQKKTEKAPAELI